MSKKGIYLVITLTIIALVRLPSLFEPNWYGDEGIYLTIGKAIREGGVLYKDIWDNKTPLLYLIYAIYPTLWFAKFAALIFVLGTTTMAFFLAKKIGLAYFFSLICALAVGTLLSIPYFEGTIANAELFFVLPTICAAYLVTLEIEKTRFSSLWLFLIGVFAGFAFLIKVPALFDFFGMFLFLAVFAFKEPMKRNERTIFAKRIFYLFLPIAAGIFLPIFASLFYFYMNNALPDYLMAAFSQNASYVAVGSGALSKLSNPLFLKGGLLLAGTVIFIYLYISKKIPAIFLFLVLWFFFSIYGALLSNRPYMHYLLQIVPPTVILSAYLLANFRKYFLYLIPLVVIISYILSVFNSAFHLHIIPYYRNFIDYVSEKKSWEDYAKYFDSNVIYTYEIADFIRKNSGSKDTIFVWNDSANIYVLSDRKPAAKFIQAHHLTTVDDTAYGVLIRRLSSRPPKIIIIPEKTRFAFPKLVQFVENKYKLIGKLQGQNIFQIKNQTDWN